MYNYLLGLHYDSFEGIPNIYVTSHHMRGWRYFATYNYGNSKKELVFQKLAEKGMIEITKDWSWHHVVEGNHLRPLFSSTDHKNKYDHEWPTVLMHTPEEHTIYNRIFRSQGTLMQLSQRKEAFLTGNQRNIYLNNLYNVYQNVYIGDHILQRVAHNVIKNIR